MRLGFVKFAVLFIAVVLVTSVAASYLATTFLPVPPDYPAPDVEPLSSQYLTYMYPQYHDDKNGSRIFLIDANPRYGYFKYTPSGLYTVQKKWDPCLILNMTIRNDYSEEHPLPSEASQYWNLTEGYYVTLEVLLYNKAGPVDVKYLTVPTGESLYLGAVRLKTGETMNFDLYIGTDNRDIDHFEVCLLDVGGPPPVPA